jgi:ubiquitin-protein ligase E3 C
LKPKHKSNIIIIIKSTHPKHCRRKLDRAPLEGGPQPTRIVIRRSRVLEDALAALIPSGTPLPALRSRLSVSFVDLHGNTEVGIDMGGLTKELLESVVAAAFDPNRGLFAVTQSGGECYPHPTACSQPYGPELLTLAGAVIGRAMFDGVLLHAPLAPFFVARLQGRLPTLDDLATLDQEVWRSLVAIKRFQGDAEDLQLDFTVESDLFGAKQVHELIPHGSDISVTSANKLQYCHLVADWHLRRRLSAAAAAFGRGLAAVLPPAWLRLFSPREINMLLGGGEAANVDVNDMIKHTQYAGGYTSLSGTIKNFWKVVKGLDRADQSALLRFVTGVGRAPLGGFGYMNPPLTIHKLSCDAGPLALFGGRDVDRLPSASTCANTLKLPNYRRESTLREKLLCAIRSGAGFDLS